MHVVILGAGRVGLQLAKQLVNERKEVVIIEKDTKRAQDVSRQLDCLIINDNGNSIEGLEKAQVSQADFFISVTESDEINMIACALVASTYDKPVTVARVRNFDYSKTWRDRTGFLGINHIVNPEIEVAQAISRAVEYGAVSSVVDFETSSLQMRNIQVDTGSVFEGQQLMDLRRKLAVPFIVAVIARDNRMIIPTGKTKLQAGDHIWILADSKDFETILKQIDKSQVYLKNIVLAGGGNVGTYIAQYLLESWTLKTGLFKGFMQKKPAVVNRRNVHIVERSYKRCKQLAELLPAAQITNADISEEQVLEEGRFHTYDLLITATGNQELNIVTAAYARKAGISRSLALVKKSSTAEIARSLGIDAAISINETLVNSIQKIIRKNYATSVYNFSDSDLEMLEIPLSNRPGLSGKLIRDIQLPGKSLIIMITRNKEYIIPYGDLELQPEDYLMIITSKKYIREFE